MSEFKISPAIPCKIRSKSNFLSWFLLVIFALDMTANGWMFFRLSKQVALLEQKLQGITTTNGGNRVQQ